MAGWLPLFRSNSMQIGSNLSQFNYFSIETPFIDVFKCAAGWFGQGNGTSQFVDIDSNGWPLSMNKTTGGTYTSLRTFIHSGTGSVPPYKSGDYVVRKTGTGTVSYGWDAVIQSSSSTRDVIRCATPTDGFYIDVTAISSGPMTFKVCHVDDEAALIAGTLVHPSFAAKVASFNPLRFMDWGNTNYIDTKAWADRTPYTYAFWGDTYPNDATPVVNSRSVPVEAMVAVCNELGKDMYICMPYGATDDYMTQCATYVKNNLNSPLKCYVEFANEYFNVNWSYVGGDRWFWLDDFLADAYVSKPGATSDFDAGFDWSLVRAVVNAGIWATVWSGQSSRLVRVMASQASFDDRVRYQLEFADSRYFTGQAYTYFDALATAPYFGATAGDNSALTVTELFQEINSGGVSGAVGAYPGGWIKEAVDWAVANKIRANAKGLRLISYEGGQHFVDYSTVNTTLQTLYQTANADARMGTAYTSYLQQLRAAGVEVFCHFLDIGVPSKFGYWGALPAALDTSSPKHDALKNFT